MASTIRVRAIANGDTTEVQTLIQHPMDSGFIKDDKGEFIPAHFIQELTFEHNGKPVFVADWGTAVSKDPYVKFAFKGAAKGDDLKVSWIDNKGGSDSATFKIAREKVGPEISAGLPRRAAGRDRACGDSR
jgi:sulfur-oxidizing protein SoxZ